MEKENVDKLAVALESVLQLRMSIRGATIIRQSIDRISGPQELHLLDAAQAETIPAETNCFLPIAQHCCYIHTWQHLSGIIISSCAWGGLRCMRD